MRFRNLGNTGLKVSELAFGTMTFGGATAIWRAIGALDERTATAMVAGALDAGINFFDTADGYGSGDSEAFLGRALGRRKNEVVIATKAGFPTGSGPNERGLSRARLFAAAEASLKRLDRDTIDVYLLHRRDPSTPGEETMRALEDLVRSGKIRYAGASNFPAWEIADLNGRAEASGRVRLESLQMYYSLAARDIEREVVPYCRKHRVGLTVWSPLSGGALTGKYGRAGEAPEGTRRAAFSLGPLDWERLNGILEVTGAIARERGVTPAQVALAWLLGKEHVTSVIIGARTPSQLEENLGAAGVTLEAAEMARLDEASALPPEYPGWYLEKFDLL